MAAEYFSASEVRGLILEEVADWGSQRAVAKRIGVSDSYLSDVLLCRREPGPKVAGYFNLAPEVRYRAMNSEETQP